MNYYIAKADTLEKVIDLNVSSMTTMDYIKLTNQYFQLITGEYILLSENVTATPKLDNHTCSERNTYWGLPCDNDDEYGDETTGWSGPALTNEEDDEYGEETTGWGF